MLEKMGWSEGKGLGKHEDGRIKHVKVALRADNVGTGVSASKDVSRRHFFCLQGSG